MISDFGTCERDDCDEKAIGWVYEEEKSMPTFLCPEHFEEVFSPSLAIAALINANR